MKRAPSARMKRPLQAMKTTGQHRLLTPGNLLVVALSAGMWAAAFMLPVPVPAQPLRVAVPLWPGAEPWVMARAEGKLRPDQIKLVEINWTSAAMRAVGNRVVDAAILSLEEALLQIHQGYPLKILMVTDVSRGADALLVNPGIESLADLRGRRIGFEPRTAGTRLLGLALAEAGLSMADIRHVVMNATELQDGGMDRPAEAVVCSEPWRQRLVARGMRPLYDSGKKGAEVVRVLVAHVDAVADHRDELLVLVRAHVEGMPRLAAAGAELEPVLRREGVSAEEFARIMEKMEVPALEQNRRWLACEDGWLESRLEQLRAELLPADGLEPARRAADVFDPWFLEEAR